MAALREEPRQARADESSCLYVTKDILMTVQLTENENRAGKRGRFCCKKFWECRERVPHEK
jgi:hypothetical protein